MLRASCCKGLTHRLLCRAYQVPSQIGRATRQLCQKPTAVATATTTSLPVSDAQSSLLPVFTDQLPLVDSTRVQLESVGQGQSNYINANYLQVKNVCS